MSLPGEVARQVAKQAAIIAIETAVEIIKRMVPTKDRELAFSEADKLWFRARNQAKLDARKAKR